MDVAILARTSRPSSRECSRTWICVSVYRVQSAWSIPSAEHTRGCLRLERRFALTDDGQPLGAHPITGVGSEEVCFRPVSQPQPSFGQVQQLWETIRRWGERGLPTRNG